jgi:hypothetical protein
MNLMTHIPALTATSVLRRKLDVQIFGNEQTNRIKLKLAFQTKVGSMLGILREKFSPGPAFEPGSPALRAGALLTAPPRRITGPCQNSSLS